MKEGAIEDAANKERIAKLLWFASTHNDSDEQDVTLEEYISRMPESQDKIYYITADNYTAAKNSPHLEVFRKKGIEVLLMSDRIDEWAMGYFTEFDGKKLASIAKGELDLDKLRRAELPELAKLRMGQMHATNEWVDLDDVIHATKVLALTIMDWCGWEK